MAIDNHKKSFVMNTLRRGTYRWPGRWLAEKRSALGKGYYFCENPECGVVVKKRFTQMDHNPPVVPVEGWDSWEGVIDRMFCSPDNYQRLCKDCHAVKTKEENQQRPRPAKKKKGKRK